MKKRFVGLFLIIFVLFLTGCGTSEAETVNGIDVDLTQMSSTMVYSEVYNMVSFPEEYEGKTVKMQGTFSVYHDAASDKNYYACLILDAAACCSQGIEFVMAENLSYPEEYPVLGSEITVIGTFDTYRENGNLYCQLRNAAWAD